MFNLHISSVIFKQDIEDLEGNFKIVDNFKAEESVISHFKYEFIPKKIDSHLTHKTDGARPYCFSFCRLSILAGKYNRDLSPYEIEKCKKDTSVFDGGNCISNALDFLLKFKGEE